MKDNIEDIFFNLGITNFKVVGNKVIIDSLDLTKFGSSGIIYLDQFKKFKYNVCVGNLVASVVPECVKVCDELTLNNSSNFNNYIPIVHKKLNINGKNDIYNNQIIKLNNTCNNVYLEENVYSGNIKAGYLLIRGIDTSINSLTASGTNASSTAELRLKFLDGDNYFKNFNNLIFRTANNDILGSLHFTNIKHLDILGTFEIYRHDKLEFSNVSTLKVNERLESESITEVDTLIYDNLYGSYYKKRTGCKGIYLCSYLVYQRRSYTKENYKELPSEILEFIKFK